MLEGLELDHVFVCASSGEEDTTKLIQFGVQPGIGRVHVGQGTANVCFFFDNAYLEVLWLHDEREIRSPVVALLCLWERVRWRQSGACPFGIGFRPAANQTDAPEPAWEYAAPYMPRGATIPILTPKSTPNEPLIFVLASSGGPPSDYPAERVPILEHRGRQRRLAGIQIDLPSSKLSGELRGIVARGLIQIRTGQSYRMTLRFEPSPSSAEVDFGPELPLSLEW